MHPLDILFWTCLMLGGGFMVATLLMGGLSHAAGHFGHAVHSAHLHLPHNGVSHGHAVSHGDVGHAHNGHAQHGGHHGSGAEVEEGTGGFSILQYINPTFLAAFFFGFGSIGLISRWMSFPPANSAIVAAAGGLALYVLAYLFVLKVFVGSEATSHNRREELIGVRANVTAPIAGEQPGMISYVVGGSRQSIRAITEDEEAIPTGSAVRIRKIDENTAVVMRLD